MYVWVYVICVRVYVMCDQVWIYVMCDVCMSMCHVCLSMYVYSHMQSGWSVSSIRPVTLWYYVDAWCVHKYMCNEVYIYIRTCRLDWARLACIPRWRCGNTYMWGICMINRTVCMTIYVTHADWMKRVFHSTDDVAVIHTFLMCVWVHL